MSPPPPEPQPSAELHAIDWSVTDEPVDYLLAMEIMTARARAVREGRLPELVWLLQHPALYTVGTSGKASDLLAPGRLPVFRSGRGGQITYHGPGQRIAYLILDLRRRGSDIRALICNLERWIIAALAEFNLKGEIRPDRVGVWVGRPGHDDGVEDKIAAVGLRVSGGITTHGVSLNVDPDLAHYEGIVPCGIRDHGVTSLAALGLPVTMTDADLALRRGFEATFGRVRDAPPPTLDGAQ